MIGFPQEAFEMSVVSKSPTQSVKALKPCISMFMLDSGSGCSLWGSRIIPRKATFQTAGP